MADVELIVNGSKYGGWQTVTVSRGIESVSGSFSLGVSERWTNQKKPWPIHEDDECSVTVAGETVLTGYVTKKSPSFNATSHTVRVEGRDKTSDLVDCSALLDRWEFKGLTLLQFIEKLCKPYGIKVSVQQGLTFPKPPAKFSVDPGDTTFTAIEHECRKVGVLPVSDGHGGLVLTRVGTDRVSVDLVEGQNVKEGSAEYDREGRFARYVVLGQHVPDDTWFGEKPARIKGEATDPNVKRSARVLVVRPEGNVTEALAKKRAEWEATVRAARGSAISIPVQGWTQGKDKKLWPINKLVRVKSPSLEVDGDMLITAVSYEVSAEAGTISVLSLKPPTAFKPEPQGVKQDGLWREIARGV